MNEKEMLAELALLRDRWKASRALKLSRKGELMALGADSAAARRDREYRGHKKEQHRFSTLIRHLERRLNSKRAQHESGD